MKPMVEINEIKNLVLQITDDNEIVLINIYYHNKAEIPQIMQIVGIVETTVDGESITDGLTLGDYLDILDHYEDMVEQAMIEEKGYILINEKMKEPIS